MSKPEKKQHEQPMFHPISALPRVSAVIDGLLEETEAQHATLTQAKDKPHVLDDPTVDRVARVYTDARELGEVFDEQLTRWEKVTLTESQRVEVERLIRAREKHRKLYNEILELAAELRKGTINRILEMSDEEVGLAVLTGKLKSP